MANSTIYEPTLILHGGAGALARPNLPPELYTRYRRSLRSCLSSTRQLLVASGASALEAAVHAVSLMEDDELFNCGRGSVFNEAGENVMEASVMVSSVRGDVNDLEEGEIWRKRGAGVMEIRGTRHPIKLAREVLLAWGTEDGGSMHCQLAGEEVERWGWEERGLERKGREWFWTKRRWEEHLQGLAGRKDGEKGGEHEADRLRDPVEERDWRGLSQGTVGAVCLDQRGDLAVATSTGGLTNKKQGRIGDTPTLGAGFWAESWDENPWRPQKLDPGVRPQNHHSSSKLITLSGLVAMTGNAIKDCLPTGLLPISSLDTPEQRHYWAASHQRYRPILVKAPTHSRPVPSRRAIAVSGTGNGDSFLRTSAARTTAAMCRFSATPTASATPIPPIRNVDTSLAKAVSAVAGPGGELQRSAGRRWNITGEGQGGLIGIEVVSGRESSLRLESGEKESQTQKKGKGKVVADFNCGGMWRAWVDDMGKERVMVFREEYEDDSKDFEDQ